jgi:3-phenylpropionate/cinnamic acid dioxygenase small subunit
MDTAARDPQVQALLDRTAVSDVLYRYASTIDRKDYDGLRAVFVDDARGQYGDRPWIEGADALVDWIRDQGRVQAWQHHLVNVYHVDVEGDRAAALTYHTSHQATAADPDTAKVIVARYHDELVRTPAGWRIASKVMETLWRETRHAPPAR